MTVSECSTPLCYCNTYTHTHRGRTRSPMRAHRRSGLFERDRKTAGRRCSGVRPYTYVRCVNAPVSRRDTDRLFSSFQAVEYDGRFFVNPGSATGAWIGNVNGSVRPFFFVPLHGLLNLAQRTYAVVCIDGHSGPCRCHIRVSADRRRGQSREDRVQEGHRGCQRPTAKLAAEYSCEPTASAAAERLVVTSSSAGHLLFIDGKQIGQCNP